MQSSAWQHWASLAGALIFRNKKKRIKTPAASEPAFFSKKLTSLIFSKRMAALEGPSPLALLPVVDLEPEKRTKYKRSFSITDVPNVDLAAKAAAAPSPSSSGRLCACNIYFL
jgi:hypothetical protein